MNYLLYILSFLLAIFGWLKRERPSRKMTYVVVGILFLTFVVQSIISNNKNQEEVKLRLEISQIAERNEILQRQNDSLLTQNKEFLARIAAYQTDLENHREDVSDLRDYSYIARLDLTGRHLPGASIISIVTDINIFLLPAINKTDNRITCDCSPQTRKRLLVATKRFPTFLFSYSFLAMCFRENSDTLWQQYAINAIKILVKTTAIPNHLPVHDRILEELRGYVYKSKK